MNSASLKSKDQFVCAQGDILLERIGALPVSGEVVPAGEDGVTTIAEGEFEGHSHAFKRGKVTFYRDPLLARDIHDSRLYVGHVNVESEEAVLEHQEHAAITLPQGSYQVRRQREFDRKEARIHRD